MGKIFCIMGKSATGKDHVYQELLDRRELQLQPLVLYTTRPMREGEANGREYFFITEAQLEEMRSRGCIVEERVYQTVQGPWHYLTADEGQIDLQNHNYLAIETLEAYEKITAYFGSEKVVPLYIETEDGLRLARAMKREQKQQRPDYVELCRRFIADSEDFSEERLDLAGITERFPNNGLLEETVEAVVHKVLETVES